MLQEPFLFFKKRKEKALPDLSAVKRMVGASRLAFTMGSHLSASFLLSS